MEAVIYSTGLLYLLDQMARGDTAPLHGCHLHLFGSDHTPSLSDTLQTFTAIESEWVGYEIADVVISTDATIVVNEAFTPAETAYFYPGVGATGNVYGWFLTNPTDTVLIAAKRADTAPVMIVSEGNPYLVTLNLYLGRG